MELENVILALAALAQSTRLDVFRLLVKHEPDGLPAGDIARELAVPHNTMSAISASSPEPGSSTRNAAAARSSTAPTSIGCARS